MVLLPMPSYRYYFIVLSKAAGRYEYLDKKLASIHLHRSTPDGDAGPKFYEVVSMPASRRPSLPTNALVLDEHRLSALGRLRPGPWDVDQQQALIDWLHWGGQIIVSGPDALEQLRSSFLRPYLPASVEKSRSFAAERPGRTALLGGRIRPSAEAGETLAGRGTEERPARRVSSVHRRPAGRAASRPGRIVASAFRLTGPELTGWTGFDCFFNACLLRRPAREFSADEDRR